MKKAMVYGILASFFFAFTFIINRSMNLNGGYWLWSACLRYLFTLPMLMALLCKGDKIKQTHDEIKKNPKSWILWSIVGFVLFYVPITFSSVHGESWLVAASWQITIVAGVLLTPLFGKKIPLKNLLMGCIILAGVFIVQFEDAGQVALQNSVMTFIPILLAAFAYPLGNRKVMELCDGKLSSLQRVYGMTLCSMAVWLLLSIIAVIYAGLPDRNQVIQSVCVALLSGVVATVLFFRATDMVRDHAHQLALIEATQCGEVIFTLIGAVLFLGDKMPPLMGYAGLLLIIVGMILNSIVAATRK